MKTDAELQKHVMDELKWEPTIRAAEIGVAVKNGVVTLSGSVDSYGKKWAADRAAKRVFGVKAVTEVTPDVNSGHETLFMQQPALHRIAAHRQPGIGNPAVLAVFGDCRILRCIR